MADSWRLLWDEDSKKGLERFRKLCAGINQGLNYCLGNTVAIDYFEFREREELIGIAELSYRNKAVVGLRKERGNLIVLENLWELETWLSESLIVVNAETYASVIKRENRRMNIVCKIIAERIEREFGEALTEKNRKLVYRYNVRRPLEATQS